MTCSPPAPLTRGMVGLVVLFVGSGTTHLVRPRIFEPIVPRWLPRRRDIVYASGVAELVCAGGLLAPHTRQLAGWSSAALLAVVFTGNIQMTITAAQRWRRRPGDLGRAVFLAGTVARLPLQWPLVKVALSAAGRDVQGER
ncbi:MAG TPA: MauE/DoxX family redox-associated membrane protein [Lapillicoccus sp.]|nr:MauE/DoxX family redox-associated membrane protein [Lapillicoccus sp.]